MKMIFSVALPHELPEIAELVNSTYRGEGSRAGWTTEADFFDGARTSVSRLARELSAGPGRIFVAMREFTGGPIVGCVYLDPHYSPLECYLGMLSVNAQLQARGLGRLLLGAAEAKALSLGLEYISLRVLSPRGELMAWYERRGYARTGESSPFPYAEAAEDLPVRGDLAFVHFRKRLTSSR